MANRFEKGNIFEDDKRALSEMHRMKYASELMAVQDKHKGLIFRSGYTHSLTLNNISLSIDKFGGGCDFLIQEEKRDADRNPLYRKDISISFAHNRQDSPVRITQEVRQSGGFIDSQAALDYGNLNQAGEVELVDGQRMNVSYSGMGGAYIYSAAEKNFEWDGGVELEIAISEKDNSVIMREDPDSKGFTLIFMISSKKQRNR
jgi:hypothetical protein